MIWEIVFWRQIHQTSFWKFTFCAVGEFSGGFFNFCIEIVSLRILRSGLLWADAPVSCSAQSAQSAHSAQWAFMSGFFNFCIEIVSRFVQLELASPMLRNPAEVSLSLGRSGWWARIDATFPEGHHISNLPCTQHRRRGPIGITNHTPTENPLPWPHQPLNLQNRHAVRNGGFP